MIEPAAMKPGETEINKGRRRHPLSGAVLLCAVPAAVALGGGSSVWIRSVEGRWTGSAAELVWTTEAEQGAKGFRVFRLEPGLDLPLHEEYIPIDVFTPGGGAYSLTDAALDEGAEATYRFSALRPDDSEERIGTWTVRFSSQPLKAAAPATPVVKTSSTPTVGPALKVPVRSNAVYFVSFADIASGLGWTDAAVSSAAAGAQLAMRCDESAVAYLVDTNLNRIVFYGWPVMNRYTRTNYFWIEPGDGAHMQRIAPENVAAASNPTFFSSVRYQEENGSLVEFGLLRDDLYFWEYVDAGHSSYGTQSFDIALDGYVEGSAEVTVNLLGYDDYHLAEIWLNTNKLGEIDFAGRRDVSKTFTMAAGMILPTTNQLHVTGVLQPGVTTSRFAVDDITVGYQREYAAADGLLAADDGGNGRLSADHFSDPFVLNVTDPHNPVWIADSAGRVPTNWSWTAETNTHWALCEQSTLVSAAPQAAGFGFWLRDATNAVDYLVIAPREFEVPARELAQYRQTQGLRTAVALYENICDQFAGGLNTPEAIRDCLSYAFQNWQVAPVMAVLGGRGHYDYLGVFNSGENYLPAMLGTDTVALRPADSLIADIAGNDELPDVAIGRLPVSSTSEFDSYLAKLKAYEANGLLGAHAQAVFISDIQGVGGDFYASNTHMAGKISTLYTNTFFGRDFLAPEGVRSNFISAFDAGAGLVHYTGHGSYSLLKNDDLSGVYLYLSDVQGLVNPPVPVFVSLTCLAGRFDLFNQSCIAEELVLNSAGGSMAAFSASGLSWNSYATAFGSRFYELHAEGGADTVGMALMRTRRLMGAGADHSRAYRTYNLLGDPALKLRGGEGGTPPDWVSSYAHWRWEKFDYDELESLDSSESAHVMEYAFGGYSAALTGVSKTGQLAALSWNQRLWAKDLIYRLQICTNLVSGSWGDAPAEMTTWETPLEDGVMERAGAEIPLENENLFIKLDVIRK